MLFIFNLSCGNFVHMSATDVENKQENQNYDFFKTVHVANNLNQFSSCIIFISVFINLSASYTFF